MYLLILMAVFAVTACAPSAESNPADHFAGTWSGTMSFTDDPARKEDLIVTIPAGCAAGSVCGDINNTTISCQWEMTLASLDGNVFTYTFS
ncbi:MAG TPA: hypothetical protein VJ248_05955, partial [Candidatus Udaeobacter sp.]|nr:hypothetical protein [Candidatus Udaeobacter sp.]